MFWWVSEKEYNCPWDIDYMFRLFYNQPCIHLDDFTWGLLYDKTTQICDSDADRILEYSRGL